MSVHEQFADDLALYALGSLEGDERATLEGFLDFHRATLELKCAALKAHVSQVGSGPWVDTLLREWAARAGKRAAIPYAEAYRRMVLARGD